MGITSTQSITRNYAESWLAELLEESELNNEEIKQLLILPNKDAVIMELNNLNQLKVYSVTYVKV